MTEITYRLIETQCVLENDVCTVYGIAAFSGAGSHSPEAAITSIPDVTTDQSKLLELVRLCNLEQLCPIHLEEIVEDFLLD